MTQSSAELPLVVGITGASGTVYGQRLVEVAAGLGVPIDLVISAAGRRVWQHELGDRAPTRDSPAPATRVHPISDVGATIASGSYRTRGMVVAPCSMGTLARLASGMASNLIERAADVVLKERRPLIVVPRDTPLSRIHLENMLRLNDAGAIVLPACPSFYGATTSVTDLVDSVVARILDHAGVEHELIARWEGQG